MTPVEARICKRLYREVQYGGLSPVEADARLRGLGLEPFENRPDPSAFDPMQERRMDAADGRRLVHLALYRCRPGSVESCAQWLAKVGRVCTASETEGPYDSPDA